MKRDNTLMERDNSFVPNAWNRQLFGTKNFPITEANGECKSSPLHVIFLQYTREDRLEFEIRKAEIMRFRNGVEVFHDYAHEPTLTSTAKISLKGGFKELEDGGFIIENGAKVGFEFMYPNEVNENCMASLWITLDSPCTLKDEMHLFLHLLNELQEHVIMKPDSIAKVVPEDISHVLEALKQVRGEIEIDVVGAQFLTEFVAEYNKRRVGAILRFVHKMIKVVEDEISATAHGTAQLPELRGSVPAGEALQPSGSTGGQ